MAKSKAKTARRAAPVKKTKKPAARKTPARKDPNASPPPARTITPYLAVGDAASAINWYKNVFGAKPITVQPAPGNKIMHAALRIGDSELFLSDIFPGADLNDPSRVGASTSIHVWSKNAETWWQNAVRNGAKVSMPMDDQFWGDKYGKLVDPFGHSWSLGWRSKLSKAELERKRQAAMADFAAMASP